MVVSGELRAEAPNNDVFANKMKQTIITSRVGEEPIVLLVTYPAGEWEGSLLFQLERF